LDAFADADGDQYRHGDAHLDAFADAHEYATTNPDQYPYALADQHQHAPATHIHAAAAPTADPYTHTDPLALRVHLVGRAGYL
jgi:hypothetical protein